MYYIDSIMKAVGVCPVVALLISGIYFSIQYRTYGSVSLFRTFVLYTFMLYCMAAYFLVIFPLPNPAEVAARTNPYTQLIPLNVVRVFFDDSGFVLTNPKTYITSLKSQEFLQPVFNFLLTLPLGCYLRYYFKCSTKKAWLISFGTTFFFEMTQLSGLYGFYSRPYRLCDVDDLILNTLGSMFGFFITGFVMNILPKREEIDAKAINKGRSITGMRRIFAKMIDLFVISMICAIVLLGGSLLVYACKNEYIAELLPKDIESHQIIMGAFMICMAIYILYHLLAIIFFKGNTIGKILVGIKICDKNYKTPKRGILLLRFLLYLATIYIMFKLPILLVMVLIVVMLIRINAKKDKNKLLLHEIITHTRLVSYASKGKHNKTSLS